MGRIHYRKTGELQVTLIDDCFQHNLTGLGSSYIGKRFLKQKIDLILIKGNANEKSP